jgi:hypothetical protein
VAAFVVLWAVLVTLRHTWGGDFRLHLATLHTLSADLWTAKDPLVGEATGSPYYSPYTVLLGAITAVTGVHPRTVLEVAGIANVVLLLLALRRFCRHLGGGPFVPVLALVFTLLLWGLRPIEWSGFLGAYSVSWTMSYPSLLAAAIMFVLWDAYLRSREGPRGWRTPAVMVVLGALLVLIHPFTAVNTVIGLIAFALARPRALRDIRTLWLVAVALAVLLLVVLWPWSEVFSLFGAAGDFDAVHERLVTDVVREFGFKHYGLALVGLPALVTAARRPLGRELQVLFVISVAIIAMGALTGQYGLARAIPVAMLPLHLALASYLGTRMVARPMPRALYAGVVLLACAVGVYGESGGVIRAYWSDVSNTTLRAWKSHEATTLYDSLMPGIRGGDVVMTDARLAARQANARGAYTVRPAWPYPFVDEAARGRDNREFFDAKTSPERRRAIADRYRVRCVLVAYHRVIRKPGALPGFRIQSRTADGRSVLLCRE